MKLVGVVYNLSLDYACTNIISYIHVCILIYTSNEYCNKLRALAVALYLPNLDLCLATTISFSGLGFGAMF